MTPTPVAVMGAGPWGRTIVAAISATPGLSLAAVVSSNPETRDIVDPKIPVYDDWQGAIDTAGAAGIVLAVPPMHQPEIAIELIENGIPAMLEKPMTISVADADAIQAAAESRGFTGLVNHLHIYAPAFGKLIDGLGESQGARTVQAVAGGRGPYRSGWSALWDWAGHDLAMALTAIGGEPAEISASLESSVTDNDCLYENYRIGLSFDGGSHATLRLGNAFERKVREFCVDAAGRAHCYRESEAGGISLSVDGIDRDDIGAGVENRPLNAALIAFADRIRSGGGIDDIRLGAKVVRLIEAAESSLRSGQPVALRRSGIA